MTVRIAAVETAGVGTVVVGIAVCTLHMLWSTYCTYSAFSYFCNAKFQVTRRSMASELSADQSTEVAPSIYRPRLNRAIVRDSRSMRRVIIKQGYLKKMPSSSRLGSFFKVTNIKNNSYPQY